LPTLENGLGLLILSTPKGVCTSQQAQKNRVGGEILCQVF
jgi:small subunit ribosomal protein S8